MRVKPGVSLSNIVPQMVFAAQVYETACRRFVDNYEATITAGFDGVHMVGTLHSRDGICRAFDFRTKDYPGDKTELRNAVKNDLGADFDVVLEHEGKDQEHIHLEWDPK